MAALPTSSDPLPLLAVERARRQRHTASAAVAGVVASLALSVALTVMVASFRDSVAAWLDGVLPADLYVRSAGSSAASDHVWLTPALRPGGGAAARRAAGDGLARAHAAAGRRTGQPSR